MLVKKNVRDLADKIVNVSMRIGRKENPYYSKARNKYPWLSDCFTLKDALRNSGLGEKTVRRILDEYSKPDYGPLVIESKRGYRLKKKVGHCVNIIYNRANEELAREIERLCWENGASVLSTESSAGKLVDSYKLQPTDTLMELSPLKKAIYENIDFIIHIDAIEKEYWAKGIPVEKMKATSLVGKRLFEIRNKKKVRWLLMGWPHPEQAKELGISPRRYERIMLASIKKSYDKETFDYVNKYYKAFKNKERIRITAADGTNLEFSVKGRRFLRDKATKTKEELAHGDVGLNIPCGEVFVAPIEDSANGEIFFPLVSARNYGIVEELRLVFENGRVVDYKARKGVRHFKNFLDENTDSIRNIAELGIGCNKAAEYTNGSIIVDEKIFGTIHIAIGDNLGFGGRNNASSHLDMIKPLETCSGKVYADDKLVINNGKLIV